MSTQASDFPIIDFSGFETNKKSVAAEIFEAASKWGFLVLKGHGIPPEDIKKMFSTVCISREAVEFVG
jgi:isopenicillin N synthase-like dioxygenase